MIDRMNGWAGAIVAATLAVCGMFYRHGALLAGMQQKHHSQHETNERFQKWMETTTRQLNDIALKLERWRPPNV